MCQRHWCCIPRMPQAVWQHGAEQHVLLLWGPDDRRSCSSVQFSQCFHSVFTIVQSFLHFPTGPRSVFECLDPVALPKRASKLKAILCTGSMGYWKWNSVVLQKNQVALPASHPKCTWIWTLEVVKQVTGNDSFTGDSRIPNDRHQDCLECRSQVFDVFADV